MPERYHRDSYSTSYGAGSRRERPEGTQRTRVTIDYDHGSSYNRQRYRDGASGSAAGSGSGGRSNASSILGNYGTGANTSGYNSSSSYGATPNFSNTSGFGRASAYDGGASYGGNTSYGSGYRNKTSHGNSSSYGSKPSYSNSSNYRGSSAYGHAGHNRPVVSPWESGMAPTAAIPVANHGGFLPTPEVSGTSVAVSPATDIIGAVSQLTQMGSTQSALALNILNAVLNRESGDARQPDMDVGPPASKMRRIEWVSKI
nr:uncharacterized protein LOC128693595 [Cherax quadricarinatus]